MNWVAPLPSKAASIAITEAGSVGPAAKVKLPALTNAGPNWAAKSSNTDRFVRSVPPVFSMTTSYVTAKLPSGWATGRPAGALAAPIPGVTSR